MYDETEYDTVWVDVTKAAVDAVHDLSINPTPLAQKVAYRSASKAYESALLDISMEIDRRFEGMESFEDFRAGLDEAIQERMASARRIYDTN